MSQAKDHQCDSDLASIKVPFKLSAECIDQIAHMTQTSEVIAGALADGSLLKDGFKESAGGATTPGSQLSEPRAASQSRLNTEEKAEIRQKVESAWRGMAMRQ